MNEGSKHEGHRGKLRQRFLSGDAVSLSDAAILEFLLTYAVPQRDVRPLAKSLIAKFGSLGGVLAVEGVWHLIDVAGVFLVEGEMMAVFMGT